MLAAAGCAYAEERGRDTAPLIEVFTTAQYPIQEHTAAHAPHESRGHYTRYDIDRISLLQQALSHGLPADPAQAKQRVLQRFQSMDASPQPSIGKCRQGSGAGHAYGIDRISGHGLRSPGGDLWGNRIDEALEQYHQWREQGGR